MEPPLQFSRLPTTAAPLPLARGLDGRFSAGKPSSMLPAEWRSSMSVVIQIALAVTLSTIMAFCPGYRDQDLAAKLD